MLFLLDNGLQKIQMPEGKILLAHRLLLRYSVELMEQIFRYVLQICDLIGD